MSEHEAWASVDEIAKHLGSGKDTSHRWFESKSIPAHKVGRLSQVDAWIEAGGASDQREGRGMSATYSDAQPRQRSMWRCAWL